jgi:DeoR family transcriptional regulator, aga operon transcriptional repressor
MSTPTPRGEFILRTLHQEGRVSVDELARIFEVTPITIRRDLDQLDQAGLLRRTHGGAIPLQPLLYEPFRHDSSFQEQVDRNAGAKARIAVAAAELIEDGDSLAFTAGTTTTLVTRNLHQRRDLTVVTNTVNVAMELSNREDVTVVVTGGVLRGGWFSLVGPTAAHAMSQIFVDRAIIGVNGIDAARGLTAHNPEEAAINRVMVQQARQKIAVADRSKLGVTAASLICPATDIQILITDVGASDAEVQPFLDLGIDVRRV